jgi:outer membrane protein TolC
VTLLRRHSLAWAAITLVSLLDTPASHAQANDAPEATPGSVPGDDVPRNIFDELPATRDGLTADAVAARAVQVAPLVRSARAASRQAADAAVAGGVAFAPRLDLRASYTRLSDIDQPPLVFGGMELENPFPQVLNNYGLRATMTVEVTDYFLTIRPAYRAGKRAAGVAQHQSEAEQEVTALRAREAFYSHLRARAAVLVVNGAIGLIEDHSHHLEALAAAGQATRADLMQARAQLAEAKAELARSRGAVQITADVLRTMLDLAPTAAIAIGEDVFMGALPAPAPNPETVVRAALQSRRDVRALRELVRMHEATVRARQGARWPSLAVVGNVDYANPNPRAIPQTEEFRASWDVSAVVSWSPNDYVTRGVAVDQARLELVRAESTLQALEDQIAVQAARVCNDLGVALQSLEAAREGVEAAREAWRVRRDLLGAGEATASEVLDAEALLRRSQLAEIDAHIAAHLAHAQLQYIMGRMSGQATPQPAGHR